MKKYTLRTASDFSGIGKDYSVLRILSFIRSYLEQMALIIYAYAPGILYGFAVLSDDKNGVGISGMDRLPPVEAGKAADAQIQQAKGENGL